MVNANNQHISTIQLQATIESVVQTCATCQQYKMLEPGYGKLRCIHDHGTEFTMHQMVTNVLRPLLHTHAPQNNQVAQDIIDTALANASYASRAAVHHTFNVSPGALVFHCNMFLDIPLLADLETIRGKHQVLIDENLRHQNSKRRSFVDYQVG